MMANRIKFIPELGLWSFSRGKHTCRWQSKWCERNCYATKFYKLGWSREEYDRPDDDWWMANDVIALSAEILRVTSVDGVPPGRFRFSIKGEIWNHPTDVSKVQGVVQTLSSTRFWIPTRAWRDPQMRDHIQRYVLPELNACVLASVDPDTTPEELAQLRADGWSLVFAGDNARGQMLLGAKGARPNVTDGMHSCEKTWEHRSGHCATCEEGCFSPGRVEIHLKKHL